MINSKQIIGIIFLVFILLVGYKMISSNVQENKEKAVLQQKFDLSELAKKPLEICLKNAEDASIYNQSLENIARNPVAMEYGFVLQAKEKCPLLATDNYNCWAENIFDPTVTQEEKLVRLQIMLKEINTSIAQYEKTKQECYQQYK